ncbi:hypothetical protein L1267_21690 [Pseudoalteromonas sp. OFAV1]|jgi:hypothetical protein|uniref:hypothetical protein n=1 Tax=Pseudoalteromonas sp. OFAV1 TaxID=2908892 RepID=UPI001F3D4DF2|nr:hypothetical protein [Pseudoalteromonas sp. OFAV1]MCF2902989.1 hypothetical protein [Pseudoalteromonas sp. OFAV1]
MVTVKTLIAKNDFKEQLVKEIIAELEINVIKSGTTEFLSNDDAALVRNKYTQTHLAAKTA